MQTKLTPEITSKVKELINKHTPTHAIKLFMRDKTGLKKTQVNQHYKSIIKSMDFIEPDMETIAINEVGQDGLEITEMQAGLKTLDELLDRCAIDRKEWHVRFFKPNSWPVLSKDGPIVFSQVKAVLERIIPRQTSKRVNEMKEDLKAMSPKVGKFTYDFCRRGGENNERLLEISAFDLHLGKYVDSSQAGHSYNIEIAKEIYLSAIMDVVEKAQALGGIDRIVFPIGNDFLNVDNNQRTTTAGTPQDCDGNFPNIYKEGRKLLVKIINLLKEYAPVDVITCPGNHDSSSMFHISDAIDCYFYNDENVSVENSNRMRKYYGFGKNMIVFAHGDKGKMSDMPLAAATEEPEMWAKSRFRELHVGHIHQEKVTEVQGFKIRVIPSLSGTDVWHGERIYTGNLRVAQGFVFDSEHGLESIIYSKPVQ